MTHEDIKTKFLIEYDKASVTSSYPSLTKYEEETILDKAYLALISQKVTGNNPRKVGFENDIKAIHDLQGLMTVEGWTKDSTQSQSNEYVFKQANDSLNRMLYYIDSYVSGVDHSASLDNLDHSIENVELINHVYASKFRCTSTNMPWIENPVAYLHNDEIHVFFDPMNIKNGMYDNVTLNVTYIKYPKLFVDDGVDAASINFELSDVIAEELINLAILFATENVESPRLQTKSSILSLES